MKLKALEMLKKWNNGDYPSKQEISEAIAELEKLNNKTCRNCNLDFSFCEIFDEANSRICLSPDGFNCSLHSLKKVNDKRR